MLFMPGRTTTNILWKIKYKKLWNRRKKVFLFCFDGANLPLSVRKSYKAAAVAAVAAAVLLECVASGIITIAINIQRHKKHT